MSIDDKILWLVFGMAIGFILGYIVSQLRMISDKVDEVDEHVTGKDDLRKRNELGFITGPRVQNALILLSLLLIVIGVFLTNRTSSAVEDNADVTKRAILCNNEYLTAQSQFLRIYLEQPPATAPEQMESVQAFVTLLDAYASRDTESLENSPFTNREALMACVRENNTERLREIERTDTE